MEVLLNTIWLLLSLAALVWCAWRKRTLSKADRDWARSIVAVCMVGFFMFPVISATDDLHPAQAVLEESAVKKIVSVVHGTLIAAKAHPVLFAIVLVLLLALQAFALRRVVEDAPCSPRGVFLHTLEGRAPPVPAV